MIRRRTAWRDVTGLLMSLALAVIFLAPAWAEESAAEWFEKGRKQYDVRNWQAAVASFTKAIEIDPGLTEAYFFRGDALRQSGKTFEGMKDLRTVLDMDPEHAEAYRSLGKGFRSLKRFDDEIAAYDKAIEYTKDEKTKAALAQWKSKVQAKLKSEQPAKQKTEVAALTEKVLLKQKAGDLKTATKLCTQALERFPGEPSLYVLAAEMCEQSGNPGTALSHYEKVVILDPPAVATRFRVASILRGLGEGSRARTELETALKLDPGNGTCCIELGRVLTDLGKTQDAAEQFRKALQLIEDEERREEIRGLIAGLARDAEPSAPMTATRVSPEGESPREPSMVSTSSPATTEPTEAEKEPPVPAATDEPVAEPPNTPKEQPSAPVDLTTNPEPPPVPVAPLTAKPSAETLPAATTPPAQVPAAIPAPPPPTAAPEAPKTAPMSSGVSVTSPAYAFAATPPTPQPVIPERIKVKAMQVGSKPEGSGLAAMGSISCPNTLDLGFDDTGVISEMLVDEGDIVVKGQTLAKLDSNLLEAEQVAYDAKLQSAIIEVDFNQNEYDKRVLLFKKEAVSESELKKALMTLQKSEAAVSMIKAEQGIIMARLRKRILVAPMSGIVAKRLSNVGSVVMTGQNKVIRLIQCHEAFAEIEMGEKLYGLVQSAKKVEVQIDALEGIVFQGVVSGVGPEIDKKNRTFTARIRIDNQRMLLRPGMFARAQIQLPEEQQEPLWILKKAALLPDPVHNAVYVVKDGVALKRNIVLGNAQGPKVQVSKGLQRGDLVVVEGQDRVSDLSEVIVETIQEK